MTPPGRLALFIALIDRWFTAAEPRAAGRAGLYRIVFSLFYLWHLSSRHTEHLAGLPAAPRTRILLVEWFGGLPTSALALGVLEASLTAALVLLMIGYRVPIVTAAVLVLGGFNEGYFMVTATNEHSTAFLTIYIPLFMLLGGRWGATYSLDALLWRRAGGVVPDPSDSSGNYLAPARAITVVLAVLFLSAAIWKIGFGSTWLSRPGVFANVMLDKNVKSALLGLPVNPLAPWFGRSPGVGDALGYLVVLFEGTFFAILISRGVRRLYVPLALIFHAASALWLLVTFTPILIVYGLFVDWQALRERLWPRRITFFDPVPSGTLVALTLALAVAAGLLWNTGTGLRALFSLNGLLNWRSIWFPVLVIALVSLAHAAYDLVSKGFHRRRATS